MMRPSVIQSLRITQRVGAAVAAAVAAAAAAWVILLKQRTLARQVSMKKQKTMTNLRVKVTATRVKDMETLWLKPIQQRLRMFLKGLVDKEEILGSLLVCMLVLKCPSFKVLTIFHANLCTVGDMYT